MDEPQAGAGVSRRSLLKKSVVAGGLAWATPIVLASPAGAVSTYANCVNCPTGRLYFIRRTSLGACTNANPNNSCLDDAGGSPPGTGVPFPCTPPSTHCCLVTAGLVTVSGLTPTHTWVLAPGVEFCRAHAFGGGNCTGVTVVVSPNTPSAGFTTVTVTKANMSHSDIVVCLRGSRPGECPDGCGA